MKDFCSQFTSMLTKLGCDVVLAADGEIAYQKIKQERFDLILMDCNMPNLSGIALTERLRQQEFGAPGTAKVIIALTANAFESDKQDCLAAGMNDFIAKPFTANDIRDTLLRYLVPESKLLKSNPAYLAPYSC